MTGRAEVLAARRVVVKIGSSSLTSAAGGIDSEAVCDLVGTLAKTRAGGAEIVLVSSGAIAAGLAPLGIKRRHLTSVPPIPVDMCVQPSTVTELNKCLRPF